MWFKKEKAINNSKPIDRGMMYIERGEWQKADKTFEDVLLNQPENQDAYIGKVLSMTQNCKKELDDFQGDIYERCKCVFDIFDYEFQNVTLSKSAKGQYRDAFDEKFSKYQAMIKKTINDVLTESLKRENVTYSMSIERAYEIHNRGTVVQGTFKGILPIPSRCHLIDKNTGTCKATAWITGVSLDGKLVSGLSISTPLESGRCEILLKQDSPSIDENNLIGTTLLDARLTTQGE